MNIQKQLNDLTNRRMAIEKAANKKDLEDGKLTSRDRVLHLLDHNSFVEVGAFVKHRATDFNLDSMDLPCDGVITGYGTINGRLVYVYSQDSAVLGGAIGEMHAKKIVNTYDMALKMGAPIIGILDSAGLRLQESTDALDAFGQIYMKQSMASGVIPQISAIVGNCGGGSAIAASLSDFTFMTSKYGRLYVNSANTFDDTKESLDELSDADFNARVTGLADMVCDTDEELLVSLRQLVELLPANNKEDAPFAPVVDDPNRLNEELNQLIENGFKGRTALAYIVDDHKLIELKKDYGSEVVTAFAKMNGMTVGFIASETTSKDGRLTVNGLTKTSEFIAFCDAFGIPLVTLTDIFGYETLLAEEKAGLAKAAGKVAAGFTGASVPKVNVICGRAYGSAYVSYNSKHVGADVVLAWPSASVSMMDAEQAVRIMYAAEIAKADLAKDFIRSKTAEYKESQSSAYRAASRGYIDDIIEPAATRKRIIVALEMLFTKSVPFVDRKHSTM